MLRLPWHRNRPTVDAPKPSAAGGAQAFDLYFETTDGVAQYPGRPATRPRPSHAPAGWIGTDGPGIDPLTWPRGPQTGLPMFHAITLLLPEQFRRRGPQYPAIAFFQGEGQFASPYSPTDADDPFHADVERSVEHPQLGRRVDIIDGQFALVWLTQAEFDTGPTGPPADSRRPGEHVETDEGPNALDTLEPTRRVWLLDRPDLNAGHAPVDALDADETPGYVTPYDENFERLPWAAELAWTHLGGTCFSVQWTPKGLTPYYLELEELPGLNFGGGNAQIDLESEVFDWACG